MSSSLRIGLINADMFGHATEPGEHVNWSEPDYWLTAEFERFMGQDIGSFAEGSPHMIVFYACDCEVCMGERAGTCWCKTVHYG